MEKALIIVAATALTAKEAESASFPMTASEAWQLAFVIVAALLTSLSNEASKQREGEPFLARRFFGDVGLGMMAGLCIPLLITWALDHFAHTRADWRASVGLSILGAYIGRAALTAMWGALLAIGQLIAKLKGVSINYDPSKVAGKSEELSGKGNKDSDDKGGGADG